MPKRLNKSDYSKYVTKFDVDMAKSILHGMSFAVDEGYGVVSMISLAEKDDFYSISDDKRYLFSCYDNKFTNFGFEGALPFLNVDEFGLLLAKKLRRSTFTEEIFIVLNVFNESVDESSEVTWETINRLPDATYTWQIEEFFLLAADAPFPSKCFVFPPGIEKEGEEIVNQYESEGTEFPEILVRDDDTLTQSEELISAIIEYTHEGEHLLRILWDNPLEGQETGLIRFSKEDKVSAMHVNDVMLDLVKRNLTLVNMNSRMDKGGKFQVQLISHVTNESDEVKDVEIRGWEVEGGNIFSMNESRIEECVNALPLEIHGDAKRIYCDSWDYPVSRIDMEKMTSPVE